MNSTTSLWNDTAKWSNRFYKLGHSFYTELRPQPMPEVHLISSSETAAKLIGLEKAHLNTTESISILSGNQVPSNLKPIASVYSGHQFGIWAGQLGDGRAILLGEVEHQQQYWEIQLKGAGMTPYSRMGDGRAVLRSSIREYLCSEAMASLGIPTTRALAITGSSLPVQRETTESAAVVTRMSPSFIRFGHFEHFSSNQQYEDLRNLADFVIQNHYVDCLSSTNPYLAFYQAVMEKSIYLLAQWQAVGFCHGVLNTDNLSILGLTMDYGPFAFMDTFNWKYICNHSDQQGRYSYMNQPQVFHWNLVRLAEALLPLIAASNEDEAMEDAIEQIKGVLGDFSNLYEQFYFEKMARKLGLDKQTDSIAYKDLITTLLNLLHNNQVDYTFFMRNLSTWVLDPNNTVIDDLFIDREAWRNWSSEYRSALFLKQEDKSDHRQLIFESMNLQNPKYILRQHLAHEAIEKANSGDFSEIHQLERILSAPYSDQNVDEKYAGLPPDWAKRLEVSCSS